MKKVRLTIENKILIEELLRQNYKPRNKKEIVKTITKDCIIKNYLK